MKFLSIASGKSFPVLATVLIALLAATASAETAPKSDVATSNVSPTTPAITRSFASPDEAVETLVKAVKENNEGMLQSLFGSHGWKLFNSGNPETDKANREKFVVNYTKSHHIVYEGDNHAELEIGDNQWPLPIPMAKSGDRWSFDAKNGRQEIRLRHIGRNELAAIQVCLAIVDAEREYASVDRDGDGLLEYADRFMSTPGKHDGLYWETTGGEALSPLGPLLAAAARDGHHKAAKMPLQDYHGYYYRILTSQGNAAPGGAYDYSVKGRLIGGFAILAWPAHYGNSGIMSFIVNHDGIVYGKDLGKKTPAIAAKLAMFNPDASWKKQE